LPAGLAVALLYMTVRGLLTLGSKPGGVWAEANCRAAAASVALVQIIVGSGLAIAFSVMSVAVDVIEGETSRQRRKEIMDIYISVNIQRLRTFS
jgi:hypothetical protein